MPRSFDLSAEYPISVEPVHAAFCEQRYWLARLAESGADAATLDEIWIDTDGTIEVVTTVHLHRDRLPAVATQFHRGDLEIVRNERWSPIRNGNSHAAVTGEILRAPVSLSGDAVLAPSEAGSRLKFAGTVRVDIPLVGGKIEGVIGAKLAELMAAEQRFTSQWVARHG